VLYRQLLRAEPISSDYFFGQHLGVLEALGVQRDLRNHGIVGNHHGHWSEKNLQVVGQLGSSEIAGIHCDKDGARRLQLELHIVEVKALLLFGDGPLYGLNLLGHHRQHFESDAIELVEADPDTRLGEAFEKLAHGFVVKGVRAVEDDTLFGDNLQMLNRIKLYCLKSYHLKLLIRTF